MLARLLRSHQDIYTDVFVRVALHDAFFDSIVRARDVLRNFDYGPESHGLPRLFRLKPVSYAMVLYRGERCPRTARGRRDHYGSCSNRIRSVRAQAALKGDLR